MVKQQRSTSQSGRQCLGVERPNTKRHLATGKSHGTTPGRDGGTRVVKVKTAYGTFVRPVSGLGFFSVVFFSIFLAPVLGNVSYPFPTN